MKAMTCEKIKAWCLAALENRQSFFILFMESCAEKGQVSLLEENTDYFKIDVLVDVLNLMKNEKLIFACSNVAFKIEHVLFPLIDQLVQPYLLKAKKIQFESLPPQNRSHLRKKVAI